jgi:PPOX class probable F420-dependent enzyme
MSDDERRAFLSEGRRTAKLATLRADGSPHVVPLGFVLDGDDWVLMTSDDSVKGRNLRRDPRVGLCVDEIDPHAFVTVSGTAVLSEEPKALLHWATVLGHRYMGAERAEQLGRRNSVPGVVLVRVTPTRTTAITGITD